MELKSSAFNQGEKIPVKYTCDGDDFSPTLEISGVPENTKSLVLIVDDPDAPVGTWVHWVVWNIQPKITKIEENTVPVNAIEGINDFGKHNYGGPCPPSGTHRYFFKSYALDKTLELDNNAKKSDVENAMRGHVIEQATLIGTYSRS